MRSTIFLLIGAAIWCAFAPTSRPPNRQSVHPQFSINQQSATSNQQSVVILDGESAGPYHRWQVTTPVLKAILAETGLFTVNVATAPATTGELSGFNPALPAHGAVVLNYDAPDERWPASLKTTFEAYVRDGGGLVIVHAADNAFPGWKAYNEMIGVGGWRNRNENAGPQPLVTDLRQ